jgi:hypothetical protein
MVRRWSLGLALSVALHGAAVGGLVAWMWLRGAIPSRVDIDIMDVRSGPLKDLPLGAPPAGAQHARARPRARAVATEDKDGTLLPRDERGKPRAGDGDGDEGGPGPTELRQLGPEGSRFTMLLRVDRLKGTPFADPVDTLLMHMPDRRDLLEGTGLSFYDDFEALLVATPNPLDYTVTFLAARHHVADGAMHAAIDRGARATNRVIAWRTAAGRPWGERRARAGSSPPANRDERIIVLPAPGLVVATPPAYRALLMGPARRATGGADAGVDIGAVGGSAADGGAGAPAPSWAALLRRIDDESGLLPANAVAMASAVDIFKRTSDAPILFLGIPLEVPRALTAVLGIEPEPFVELTATFADEDEARRWEASWPALQRKLRTNPYVVLGGLAPLVARLTSARDGSVVVLRLTASVDETVRLLQVAASALPS